MRHAILAALAMTVLGAGSARAEIAAQMIGSDPLTRQILTKTEQANGGVTAAVRVASGQTIELKLNDISSAPFAAPMAAAAAFPGAGLKPAEGLTAKTAKAPEKDKKDVRRASVQLKRMARRKAWDKKP
jgi:hypothetical protein